MRAPASLRSFTPCKKVKLTPGQPASACSTLLPEPTVRPAVALQDVSPAGVMVPAVPRYCWSTFARAAPAARTSTAAAHHAMVRLNPPPLQQVGGAAARH